MDSRRRGAFWLLAALVIGRALDALDLPFEKRSAPGTTDVAAAAPAAGVPPVAPWALADTAAAIPSAELHTRKPPQPPEPGTPVRVNHASETELQRLPGVGPVLAGRIVAARESGGPFRDAADLRRVRGIGSKTCDRLAPHLRFD